MGRGNAANERREFRSVEKFDAFEDSSAANVRGRAGGATGEVDDHGTYAKDGTVTWEILASPRHGPANGEPVNNLRGPRVERCRRGAAKKSTSVEVGRRQGTTVAETEGRREVGGLRRSEDGGER